VTQMKEKIDIFYFSGTGNTKWVADHLDKRLHAGSIDSRCFAIENLDYDFSEFDSLAQVGLMFPIYSSYTPRLMQEFIRKLPRVNNLPLFIIQTAWLFGGHNAADTGLPLTEKGYKPYLFANVFMPNNLNLPPFGWLPIRNGKQIQGKLKKAEKRISQLSRDIIERKNIEEGKSKLSRYFDRIQRKADLTDLARYYANDSCTGCGWCASNCPAGNIEMKDNRPVFGTSCMFCVRCYNRCPQDAIQSRYNKTTSEGYARYKGPEVE